MTTCWSEDVKKGGNQIEYEDPRVREIFEEALAKEGVACQMPKAERNETLISVFGGKEIHLGHGNF